MIQVFVKINPKRSEQFKLDVPGVPYLLSNWTMGPELRPSQGAGKNNSVTEQV